MRHLAPTPPMAPPGGYWLGMVDPRASGGSDRSNPAGFRRSCALSLMRAARHRSLPTLDSHARQAARGIPRHPRRWGGSAMWRFGSAAALQFGRDGGSAAPHLISAASRHRWQMRAARRCSSWAALRPAAQQLGTVAARGWVAQRLGSAVARDSAALAISGGAAGIL